jgi:hypothetical protein
MDAVSLKKDIEKLAETIGNLASVELTLLNELSHHSIRSVHVRDSLRDIHKISDELTDLLEKNKELLKQIAPAAPAAGE